MTGIGRAGPFVGAPLRVLTIQWWALDDLLDIPAGHLRGGKGSFSNWLTRDLSKTAGAEVLETDA